MQEKINVSYGEQGLGGRTGCEKFFNSRSKFFFDIRGHLLRTIIFLKCTVQNKFDSYNTGLHGEFDVGDVYHRACAHPLNYV